MKFRNPLASPQSVVSMRGCVLYGGRRTFGDEKLVGPKIPAGGGRAERAEVPTLLIGPQYGQGRPGQKARATARQVRPYAWPDHRTYMLMHNQRLHPPQGCANVSPEHGWGSLEACS